MGGWWWWGNGGEVEKGGGGGGGNVGNYLVEWFGGVVFGRWGLRVGG